MARSGSKPIRPDTIPLWPGDAPGSEGWDQVEEESFLPPDIRAIRNVTHPSLTAYLPAPAKATGAAVIVCPGGGFRFLNIDLEGTHVARWLARRGVAAFLLRYRLLRTGDDFAATALQPPRDRAELVERTRSLRPLVLADGQQAVRVVRAACRSSAGAARWGVKPDRIGMLGFSAGGLITESVAVEHDAESRPDFVGVIYGARHEASSVPADPPPLFVLCASDDKMAAPACLRLYSQWREAGGSAELHIYAAGGHGFGMRKTGLPAEHWIERFGDWMQAQGLLKPL